MPFPFWVLLQVTFGATMWQILRPVVLAGSGVRIAACPSKRTGNVIEIHSISPRPAALPTRLRSAMAL